MITANSPASQGENPSNWESVLWHEFCHVVTLSKTENKMPRWLSEGISVYEEVRENPTWGQTMNPNYLQMIREGELTPIAEMSSAFMAPESGQHLEFAYFQSSLVVEYIVEEFGIDALKSILDDLRKGIRINDTLERNTNGLKALQKEFGLFVDKKMASMSPDADWKKPEDPEAFVKDPAAVMDWLRDHPNSYWALSIRASQLLRLKNYKAALEPLDKMVEIFPEYTGAGSAYPGLVIAHRGLGNEDAERKTLETLVDRTADEIGALKRLLAIQSEAEDWPAALKTADRLLAVNPLLPTPHRIIAKAAEVTGKPDAAIGAYRTLIAMKPQDPAVVHFRLAKLLHEKKDPSARRHVLMSLEEAPRYRDALSLLLKLTREKSETDKPKVDPPKVDESEVTDGRKTESAENSSQTEKATADSEASQAPAKSEDKR